MSVTPSERFSLESAPAWAEQPDFDALLARNRETGAVNLYFQQEQHCPSRGRYVRNVYRLENAEAVKAGSNVEFELDPSRYRLAVHFIRVVRNGQVVSEAEEGEFRFIQPEEARHSLVFDGRYLVIHLLEDVRVGDVIDIASTTYNVDPTFPGHHFGGFLACAPAGSDFVRAALHHPTEIPIYSRVQGGDVEFQTLSQPDGSTVEVLEAENEKPKKFSGYAPSWYQQLPALMWTSYRTWGEVAKAIDQLWNREIGDGYEDPLIEECIAVLGLDPSASIQDRVDQIIRFVQDEIRYLSLSEGIYSLVPRTPGRVLAKRFGDCKDKSILLAALLQKAGVEAHPVLVSTGRQEFVIDAPPSPGAFDHAIVRIQLGDQTRWVDPTMTGQGGNFDSRQSFPFGRGLVIGDEPGELTEILAGDSAATEMKVEEDIYLEGGKLRIELVTTASGTEADAMRMQRARSGSEQFEEGLREFTARFYQNAAISKPMEWRDDLQKNVIRSVEHYTADAVTEDSPIPEMGKHYPITPVVVGTRILVLEKGDFPDTPVALPYPMNLVHKIRFHHSLHGVKWNPTRESIQGPGFRYEFNSATVSKRVDFVFTFSTTKRHLETGELPEYREKVQSVFASLGRGVPAGRTAARNLAWIAPVVIFVIYIILKAIASS